jgi:alkaline phosphatase
MTPEDSATPMSATATPSKLLVILLVVSFLTIPSIPITEGQTVVRAIPAADEPLSIILMIGDGMGFNHVELARLVEVGEYGSLNMQNSDWNASSTTYSANAAVTDSAAAGTALATGTKTNNGVVGEDPSLNPLETILEYAQTLNKSTGVVSTCYIVDATPASFMTHTSNRGNYLDIAQQIVDSNVEVLLGGGTIYFNGSQISTMVSNGYSVVYNRTDLANVASGKVFGLFASDYMDYEYDRDYSVQPSIAEMTNKSIELLSQDPDGFFLMVEGGKIDLAAHATDKVRDALDTIAFDKAVAVAKEYVEAHSNTILIVTADHETMGLVVQSHNLSSELPGNLPTEAERRTLRAERASNVTVDWTATYHTNWPVPVFAFGNAFSGLQNNLAIDNIDIHSLMMDFYMGSPLNETEFSTTTTSPGTTDTTTGTTTEPTGPGGFTLDAPFLLAISIGTAVVILGVIVLIRRR